MAPLARAPAASRVATFATSSLDASGWTLTLERGIGKAYGAEAELQATRAFRAEVFPDLPIATTWQNLAKAVTGGLRASATADPAPPFTHYTTRPSALKVITTAANLRSERDIEARVLAAAGDGAEAAGGQRADVLLCVSGSHPVRSLPFVTSFLRSSLDTLRIASRLRQAGHIPPSTQLWVVANPNGERDAALLERKAALGASAVLTQPALDWPAYLAWLADAERRALLRPVPPPSPPPSSPPTSPPSGPPPEPTSTRPAEPSAGAPPAPAPAFHNPRPINATNTGGSSGGGSTGSVAGPLRLLVGHPMLSSAANLSFWLSLSGCGGSAAARGLLAEALRAEAAGKEAGAAHLLAYNRRLVQQVLERGGAAGMHVMPITKAAKRTVLAMLADGSLPPSAP